VAYPILANRFDSKFVARHTEASMADEREGDSVRTLEGTLKGCEKVLTAFKL